MCAAQEDINVNSRQWRQWKPRQSARVLPEAGYRCPVCPTSYSGTRDAWEEHLTDPLHRYNYYCSVFQNDREHKAQDRHGARIITRCKTARVVYNERDGTVKSVISPEKNNVVYEFEVVNISRHGITLCDVFLLHPYPVFKIHEDDNFINTRRRVKIHPGASCSLRICFNNTGIGSYGVPIAFNILSTKGEERSKSFDIVRVMVINVVGPNHIATKRKSDSPFTGQSWNDVNVIIYSVALGGVSGRYRRRITGYKVTEEHKMMFDNWLGPWQGMSDASVEDIYYVMSVVTYGYTVLKECYDIFFHIMLYLEEHDANTSLEHYNMSNAQLRFTGSGNQLELDIPGLSEKRPQLARGDLIYVRIRHVNGIGERVAYEGIITHIFDSVIWMSGFSSEFYERFGSRDITYDIHFTVPRFPIYVMHRAVDLAMENGLLTVLFPNEEYSYTSLFLMSPDDLFVYNPGIATNVEQALAVTYIIQGDHRPAPYIIFGPPGTGKTVTIVESVLQIKEIFPHSRILVCAPSNSACDVLARKLIRYCSPVDLFRVYSSTAEWSSVPESIYRNTNRGEARYYFPKPEMIARYRIVICTLVTASRLVVPPPNTWYPEFTHIFIDECGQATEPESLVAIAGLLGQSYEDDIGGQLILAGDPRQLGPVCRSYRAEQIRSAEALGVLDGVDQINERIGLGVSLLERLMSTNKLYQQNSDGYYDHRFITKLLYNYRSHPDILELPNKLFYDKELIYACPENVLYDPILDFPLFGKGRLLRKLSPLVFHGVIGHELREGEAPSFFNAFEIDQVLIYVERLLDSHLVTQKDIGIISPYIRQVYKIKERLEEKGWRRVEVGSTESFQGKEKRIVIVSLVRGNKNLLDLDSKYQVGFLNNPRRFNVTLTRAKSLLIVIGNPFVVGSDPQWIQLIRHCREKGSYTGCAFQIRDSQWIRIVNQKMDKLKGHGE